MPGTEVGIAGTAAVAVPGLKSIQLARRHLARPKRRIHSLLLRLQLASGAGDSGRPPQVFIGGYSGRTPAATSCRGTRRQRSSVLDVLKVSASRRPTSGRLPFRVESSSVGRRNSAHRRRPRRAGASTATRASWRARKSSSRSVSSSSAGAERIEQDGQLDPLRARSVIFGRRRQVVAVAVGEGVFRRSLLLISSASNASIWYSLARPCRGRSDDHAATGLRPSACSSRSRVGEVPSGSAVATTSRPPVAGVSGRVLATANRRRSRVSPASTARPGVGGLGTRPRMSRRGSWPAVLDRVATPSQASSSGWLGSSRVHLIEQHLQPGAPKARSRADWRSTARNSARRAAATSTSFAQAATFSSGARLLLLGLVEQLLLLLLRLLRRLFRARPSRRLGGEEHELPTSSPSVVARLDRAIPCRRRGADLDGPVEGTASSRSSGCRWSGDQPGGRGLVAQLTFTPKKTELTSLVIRWCFARTL